MRVNIYISYIFITLLLLIQGCANQLPPGGGEEDKIPPQIIEVYPPDGTTKYPEDYIELEFSEYVDKRTLRDAIFVSPYIAGNIELDWSGKSVRIIFPEKLKENTTYVVTIGTDVVDYNNRNRMAESYSLTFSTGENVDRRVISGKVYGEKPEGILIFAYKAFSDTINPSVTKPDYLSQTGADGRFKIGGLAAGTYRVFAVDDDFRDLLFQPEQDRIGIPFSDVVMGLDDTLYSGLNFFLTKIDSVPPRLQSAAMTDRNHILITLSEEFDSTIVKSGTFYIYDSTSNKRSELLYAYKGDTKKEELVLVTKQEFDPASNYFLFANELRDKKGNSFRNEAVSLTITDREDTTKPAVTAADPRPGSATADYQNQSIYFRLNDAVDSTRLKSRISFTDTLKKNIPFAIHFLDDASFKIFPSALEPSMAYIITINLPGITDVAGNTADSVYTSKFKTINGLDFTGVSGIVNNVYLSRNPLLVLEGTKENTEKYYLSITEGEFKIDRARAGSYILWGFYDEDSSGTYSYGNYVPFKYAEEFAIYPDTLNLRPRWVVTDLKFNFVSP